VDNLHEDLGATLDFFIVAKMDNLDTCLEVILVFFLKDFAGEPCYVI